MRANLSFQVVAERHEKGATILTFWSWALAFADDPVLTAAMLDQLLHHLTVVATSPAIITPSDGHWPAVSPKLG